MTDREAFWRMLRKGIRLVAESDPEWQYREGLFVIPFRMVEAGMR